MRINYKSDFDFYLDLRDANGVEVGWPTCDFRIVLTTSGYTRYEAGCVGGVQKNVRNEDGRIHVVCDRHGLLPGKVKATLVTEQPNGVYGDGHRHTEEPVDTGIELVTGAGDEAHACSVELVMGSVVVTAYDMAVRNGYRGTQEEWEAALRDLPIVANQAYIEANNAGSAAAAANAAASNANDKANAAETAASNANDKANAAETAASNANEAAGRAEAAQAFANRKAAEAGEAARLATSAASSAGQAIGSVYTKMQAIDREWGEKKAEMEAIDREWGEKKAEMEEAVETCGEAARAAVESCGEAVGDCQRATSDAEQAASDAETAASNANAAALRANTAADKLDFAISVNPETGAVVLNYNTDSGITDFDVDPQTGKLKITYDI